GAVANCNALLPLATACMVIFSNSPPVVGALMHVPVTHNLPAVAVLILGAAQFSVGGMRSEPSATVFTCTMAGSKLIPKLYAITPVPLLIETDTFVVPPTEAMAALEGRLTLTGGIRVGVGVCAKERSASSVAPDSSDKKSSVGTVLISVIHTRCWTTPSPPLGYVTMLLLLVYQVEVKAKSSIQQKLGTQ